jgi:glycosyltransferase involved in cell wall biosynthesis
MPVSTGPARVVLLSKALISAAYRRKAEMIGGDPAVELHVVVPPLWRDGDVTRPLEPGAAPSYRLHVVPIARPGSFHTHTYPGLASTLARIRPHLVHIDEEPYNLATFQALRASRALGSATLFFTWQNLRRAYPPPFGWFERYAYRRVDGAMAGSRTAAAVLRRKGYRGSLWVVPQFGVDEESFRPADPAPEGTPGAPVVVGYAGRLVAAKGVDVLLQALASVGFRFRLEVVGGGEAEAELKATAERLGIGGAVAWRPWLASGEMPAFFQSLDVLVLPSRTTPNWAEQFGRVLVEAMACAVPCVGSASGEIPHVIGDGGVIVPEGDPAHLARALSALAADGARRRQLGRAGRERVLEHFTMARVAGDTLDVYRHLLGLDPAASARLRARGAAL